MTDFFRNEDLKKLKILAILFNDCNNNCSFCFERQCRGIPSKKQFAEDPLLVVQSIEKCLEKRHQYDQTNLNLMGGELFYDNSIEGPLMQVLSFAAEKKVDLRLTTNLLYEDLSFLKSTLSFLRDVDVKWSLYTSFDFKTRFSQRTSLDLFMQNLQELRNCGVDVVVECIRTREMLKSLGAENDYEAECFKEIASQFKVCLNELVGYDRSLSLAYDESVALWKAIIQQCPTSDIKSHFTDRGRNCANIKRLMVIGDKIYEGCVPQKHFLQMEEKPKIEYLEDFTKKFNCFNCKYMNDCSLKCPMDEQYEKCDIKEVRDWLEFNNVNNI